MSLHEVVTNNLDLWTSALVGKPSSGRGTNGKHDAYGIKKLRELILELAVRGKLVPQDPNDEPASVVLARISREKERLLRAGEVNKEKALPEIAHCETPFALPKGWEWSQLRDLSAYIQRGKGPQYADYGKVQVVSQKCVQWWGFDLSQARYVDDASLEGYQPERFLRVGDLLWNSTGTGTVGRINVVPHVEANSLVADSHVTIIRPLLVNSNFVCCYISAPGIQLRIKPEHENSLVSGTTKQVELNLSTVIKLPIPVPPLTEQHRIVAKLDELMALCDQLEQQQSDSIEAHEALVETLLGTLTQAASPQELTEAWSRIANHFDALFTTEYSIDQLKQTILQLAVMGKLVPQDPNDEPASVLLDNIQVEKSNLVSAGKIKKEKEQPPIVDEERWFELPSGWEWVRFSDYAVDIATGPFGSMIHQSDYVTNGVPLINPSHMINDHIVPDSEIAVSMDMAKSLESYLLAEGDIVMARRGEVGRIALVTKREAGWLCGTGSFVLRFGKDVVRHYLKLVFRCNFVRNYLAGEAVGTTMVNLNHGILKKMPLAVPPIAEQQRIVAKVDELMTLCDALKTQLFDAQMTQVYVADVIVEQAVA